MASSYLTDHRTALREADVEGGVPESSDVWKRTAPTGTYELDTERSRAEFVVRKLGLYPVEGRFGGVDGSIQVTQPLETSRVELTVDVSTVDTDLGARDAHLRSGSYLGVKRHPKAHFVSEHVQPLGNDTFAVHGQLTIKGITEPAVFHVTLTDRYRQPGRTVVRFTATAEIDRRAFRVPQPEALALWGAVVAPSVRVQLHLEASCPTD